MANMRWFFILLVLCFSLITALITVNISLSRLATSAQVLAFSMATDRVNDIYVLDVQNRLQVNITNHPADDFAPDWSPDGTEIAFTSDRTGDTEIYVIDTNGRNTRRLSNSTLSSVAPMWSPDGRQVAYISIPANNSDVYVVDADGSNVRWLNYFGTYNDPIGWMDNDHIAIAFYQSEERRIMITNTREDEVRFVEREAVAHLMEARSPDGQLLIYEAIVDGKSDLFVRSLADGASFRLTDNSNREWSPVWSWDGRQIAFLSEREGQVSLFLVDADGRNLREIIRHTGEIGSIKWQPNR